MQLGLASRSLWRTELDSGMRSRRKGACRVETGQDSATEGGQDGDLDGGDAQRSAITTMSSPSEGRSFPALCTGALAASARFPRPPAELGDLDDHARS